MKPWLTRNKGILLLSAALWAVTFSTSTAKKAKATPAPVASKKAALAGAVQFWAYDKGADIVSDVSGIFDQKAQKISLKCELKNRTSKEIHGVRGTVRFSTYFGETIADIYVETDAPIRPGEIIGVNWTVGTDRLAPGAFEKFKNTKLDKMKQVWVPRVIVFSDGTVLK
jgi:hypothetical protein